METFYDKIENMRLKKIAESRINDNTTFFKSLNEQGFSMEELEELAESVEISSRIHTCNV